MFSTWMLILLWRVSSGASEKHQQNLGKYQDIIDVAADLEKNFLSLDKPIKRGATKLPSSKIDIIFALDASNDSNVKFFDYQKNLTRELIKPFNVSPSDVLVAIVSCSGQYTHFNFFFNDFVNKECVLGFIPTLRYQNKGRAIGCCLRSIHWQAFAQNKTLRRDAKPVLFVISGGKSFEGDDPSLAAKTLKRIGVEIFALSLGSNNGYHQLQNLVSQPIKKHVFRIKKVQDTAMLVKLFEGYHHEKCQGSVYHDRCNRVCQCKNGRRTTKCARVRHEFTSMPKTDRRLFVQSFKDLTLNEHLREEFKKLVDAYREHFSNYIHTERYFLPWHRNFLLQTENLLRRINCRITVPFWDWTLVSGNPWRNSTNDLWSASCGLGGDGKCVDSGPFRKTEWSLLHSNGKKSCLRRNFDTTSRLPNISHIQKLLKTSKNKFPRFEDKLRQYHHIVTCAIGGTMCSVDNILAPEYLLIASFIDHIWESWQSNTPDQWPIGFPVVSDLLPGFTTYTGEILDNNNLPGCVRVKYDMWTFENGSQTAISSSNGQKDFSTSLTVSRRMKQLYNSSKENERTTQENITKIGQFSLKQLL